jgi:DNA-binding PadR family transcriptional regulator
MDAQNDPGLLLLVSLAEGPKHGHAMLQDVERFAGVRLGPGTLYGALSRLEERGEVEALAPEGRRRPYRLTDAGRATLGRRLDAMRHIIRAGLERAEP